VFIFFIQLFLSESVHIIVLSFNQIINNKKTRKLRKNEKELQKKGNNKTGGGQQPQRKLPQPIIYQDAKQRNILLKNDNDYFKQHREQTMREAEAITNYFLELHKDIINSYSSEYSTLLENIFNSSWDDHTILERFTDYPFDLQNIYSILNSNRDNSLKMVDNIITNNLNTFIKSIEFTQRFYKDVIESYLNYINK
jgi:hypothetical protein